MRSLFRCGSDYVQYGMDFSSLEAMIEGHYVIPYEGGEEMLVDLLAEKPNSLHCKNSRKLGISRDNAKSISYGLLYGAGVDKVKKMLKVTDEEAQRIYDEYWDAVPALKELRINVENFWKSNNKSYVVAGDLRKLMARSQHSLLNLLFQSLGSLSMKYTYVLSCQELEKQNNLGNIFIDTEDELKHKANSMIIYHRQNCGSLG